MLGSLFCNFIFAVVGLVLFFYKKMMGMMNGKQ